MKLAYIFIITSTAYLSGCASSGPINIGQNTYMISKTSAACGFASAASVKIDLYQEAASFCQKSGKELEVISSSGKDGIVSIRCASAEVQFSCVSSVKEGTPEYAERMLKQETRINREAERQPKETLIVTPPPVLVTPPPVAQIRQSTHCTSTKMGDSISTNCY